MSAAARFLCFALWSRRVHTTTLADVFFSGRHPSHDCAEHELETSSGPIVGINLGTTCVIVLEGQLTRIIENVEGTICNNADTVGLLNFELSLNLCDLLQEVEEGQTDEGRQTDRRRTNKRTLPHHQRNVPTVLSTVQGSIRQQTSSFQNRQSVLVNRGQPVHADRTCHEADDPNPRQQARAAMHDAASHRWNTANHPAQPRVAAEEEEDDDDGDDDDSDSDDHTAENINVNCLIFAALLDDPVLLREALNGPNAEEWWKACLYELEMLKKL
ncbi:hypothetical protein BDN72DRAFT_936973, partial [Pluteus cervinus]